MHRQLYAQCRLELDLTALSPLLVQGEESKGDFYRAVDPADGKEKYCIPATSLKGVWRSASEQILRSFGSNLACDPFQEKPDKDTLQFCGKRLENHPLTNSAAIVSELCPACHLFGCTVHAGLFHVADAWVPLNTVLAARTRIAIDRVTGNVAMKKMGAQRSSGATFAESPLASGTRFQMTAVSIDNVALWQIGLLALVMREMSEGTVRLGKGTRQGLGHIRIAISSLSIRYPALSSESATFAEIKEAVAHIPALSPAENNWRQALWTEHKLGNGTLQDFLRFCVECALAPRLRAGHDAGREGFFAAQTEKGVV